MPLEFVKAHLIMYIDAVCQVYILVITKFLPVEKIPISLMESKTINK